MAFGTSKKLMQLGAIPKIKANNAKKSTMEKSKALMLKKQTYI